MSYYLSTLVVYFFIDLLLAYALNLQFGWGGIPNFALIMFQAVGAYAASVVSLGPDTGINAFQRYLFGASWPFPLPSPIGHATPPCRLVTRRTVRSRATATDRATTVVRGRHAFEGGTTGPRDAVSRVR